MNRKNIYQSPSCLVISIGTVGTLLAGSEKVKGTVISVEPAGEGVSGLSRRRSVWDDDEEDFQ